MRYRIYPYKLGSKSARSLAQKLDGLCVRPDGRYRYRRDDVVINWGSSRTPDWATGGMTILNKPEAVARASNKLLTLQRLKEHGVPHVPFTTDPDVARNGATVYVRHKLHGHSGDGIEVARGDVPHAPLYTKAMNNHGEYRVHVFDGKVIDYRKKSRAREAVPTQEQMQVRNLHTGWVYRRDNLRRLERIEELAIKSVGALGLDFGAVDIIKDERGNVFTLEVNTAVGLEERTLDIYSEVIRNKFNH